LLVTAMPGAFQGTCNDRDAIMDDHNSRLNFNESEDCCICYQRFHIHELDEQQTQTTAEAAWNLVRSTFLHRASQGVAVAPWYAENTSVFVSPCGRHRMCAVCVQRQRNLSSCPYCFHSFDRQEVLRSFNLSDSSAAPQVHLPKSVGRAFDPRPIQPVEVPLAPRSSTPGLTVTYGCNCGHRQALPAFGLGMHDFVEFPDYLTTCPTCTVPGRKVFMTPHEFTVSDCRAHFKALEVFENGAKQKIDKVYNAVGKALVFHLSENSHFNRIEVNTHRSEALILSVEHGHPEVNRARITAQKFFTHQGFEVTLVQNPKSTEFIASLLEFSASMRGQTAMAVVVLAPSLAGQPGTGQVSGADGKKVALGHLFETLKAPHLRDIQKFAFIRDDGQIGKPEHWLRSRPQNCHWCHWCPDGSRPKSEIFTALSQIALSTGADVPLDELCTQAAMQAR